MYHYIKFYQDGSPKWFWAKDYAIEHGLIIMSPTEDLEVNDDDLLAKVIQVKDLISIETYKENEDE